ncbi:MAG: TonB-dependent receptor, partial [Gammaproteobacteria bacterium]|nr:TonB-dependent receptor [Gammaproteobacteria bacterium]
SLPVHAQQQPSSGARQTLDEILVTARRVQEDLQTTPVAVTAITIRDVENRQVVDISAVQNIAPNLLVQPLGGNSGVGINIRGQAGTENTSASDPAVGIYVDGVYTARSSIGFLELVDVERIEVLRGPQGTLFGRNTTGGALSIITPQPTGDLGGRLTGRLGNYSNREILGHVNVPLAGEEAGLRISFKHAERDGYGRSLTTGRELADLDSDFIRAVLRVAPDSGRWDASLSADYFNRKGNGPIGAIVAVREGSLADAVFGFGNFIPENFYDTFSGTDTFEDITAKGASLTLQAYTDWATFKSITAYRSVRNNILADVDGSPIPVISFLQDNKQNYQFTQELQAFGSTGGIEWIGGLFYFTEDNDDLTDSSTAWTRGEIKNDSIAAYGQLSYALTSDLSVTGGLRYTRDKREVLLDIAAPGPGACRLPVTDAPGVCALTRDASFNYLSYVLSANYELSDDLFLYAKTSRGHRSGGFNSRQPFPPFEPEAVTDYEIGLKTELFGNRLRVNLAGFYTQFRNVQRTVVSVVDGAPSPTTTNAAKAKIPGAELEISALPLDNLEIGAAIGIVDPKYREFNDPVRGDRSGEPFIYTSKTTWNVYGSYTIPLAVGEMRLSADYGYRSKVFYDTANPALNVQPGYGLLNARAVLSLNNPNLEFALYGRNLTDKEYNTFILDIFGPFGFNLAYRGIPRMVGAEATFRF